MKGSSWEEIRAAGAYGQSAGWMITPQAAETTTCRIPRWQASRRRWRSALAQPMADATEDERRGEGDYDEQGAEEQVRYDGCNGRGEMHSSLPGHLK
jgi:hypothetical protein